MQKKIWLSLLLFLSIEIYAKETISGVITTADKKESLIGATVCLRSEIDTTKRYCEVTDLNGRYTLTLPKTGSYRAEIRCVGFRTINRRINVTPGSSFYPFSLKEEVVDLKDVEVVGRDIRATQKNDTMQYNASAFKVTQGSNAEDLLSKMPGVVVEGGNVQAQGEKVKKILVDGKEFFEGDASIGLRNLPSDIIDNIQVFDKASEQAEFSGFSDGETTKTINIVTKKDKREGVIGKIYGGVGADTDHSVRYMSGASINYLNNDRRITFLGLSNNVNQQNFSEEDIVGANTGGQGMSRGGYRGGNNSDFMVSSKGGTTTSHAGGINYSDQFLENKLTLTGSYFFNYSDNYQVQNKKRTYFDDSRMNQSYTEDYNRKMVNMNHRFNARIEYKIDARNSLVFIPSFSYQDNQSSSYRKGVNYIDSLFASSSDSYNDRPTLGYNLGGLLLYRHRFEKAGRTLSVSLSGNLNDNSSRNLNNATQTGSKTDTISQNIFQTSNAYSYDTRIVYSEPLSKEWQMRFNYQFKYKYNDSDKRTYDLLHESLLDTLFSNVYQSGYTTHRGGVGINFKKDKWSFQAGVDYQHAFLNNQQLFPYNTISGKGFHSILPSAMLRYRINKENGLRFLYRTYSTEPSVTQLQNVINNSNLLMLKSGNPNLQEQINHTLSLRYTLTRKNGHTFVTMFHLNALQNYIGDSTYVADRDIQINEKITLAKGGQFTKPLNLDGYVALRSMFTYGLPIDLIKSNLNFSLSFDYSNTPTIYNGDRFSTANYALTPQLILGSNISEKIDFTISYSAYLNLAQSNRPNMQESKYLKQTVQCKLDWDIYQGIMLRTNLRYDGYIGTDQQIHIPVWNASIGKKILKNNALEIKLQAFDLLQMNKNYYRTISANYYEDVLENTLQPYFLLSFTFNLQSFKGGKIPTTSNPSSRERVHSREERGMSMPPPPSSGGMF